MKIFILHYSDVSLKERTGVICVIQRIWTLRDQIYPAAYTCHFL